MAVKMLAGTALLLVPTLLLLFAYTTRRHMTLEVEQASAETDQIGAALLAAFDQPMPEGDATHWGSLERALGALSFLVDVRVLGADGRVVYSHAHRGPIPGARHFSGRACQGCHPSELPGRPWQIVSPGPDGTPILNKVFAVPNRASCQSCHAATPPTLGGLLVSNTLDDAARESQLFRRSLGWTIAATLVTVLVAVALSFHVFVRRPLVGLQTHMHRVETGDLDAPLAVRTHDEIGALYRSFAHMTGELGRAKAELDRELGRRGERVQELAQRLRETEPHLLRLERVSAVGMLAARVVHEVRTPLNALGLNLQLLRRQIPEPQGAGRELEDLAGLCRKEVARVNRVLSRFSKRAELPPAAVTLARAGFIAREILSLFAAEARVAGVALSLMQPDASAELPLPGDDLRTVLINLISNAIRACSGGGRVEVRVSRPEPPLLRIAVEDTGSGIAPDDQARVFEAFFTTAQGGTGLGLPIVRRIVERWGGEISFESSLGVGTTFAFTLPVSDDGRPASRD